VHRVAPGSSGDALAHHQARGCATARTLRLSGAAHQWAPRRTGTIGARRRARRVCRQQTRGSGQQATGSWEWTGPPGRPGRLDYLQMRQQSLAGMASRRAGWGRGGKSHGTDDRAMCAGDRPTNAGSVSGIRCPASSLARGRCPIRTHVRRPTRPPLLYFPAVLTVRVIRISLLTSGAKRARTADLLHAIWRQHVHPRPSVQVTVLTRPRKSARVRVSCCTSVLYRFNPRRAASRGPR
jgi:hypothetical protein